MTSPSALPVLFWLVILATGVGLLWCYFVRIRAELLDSRARLQSLLDHVDNGVMALDAEYRVIFVNQRYLELWQFDAAFFSHRPTIAAVIADLCRRGLYPAQDLDELIHRRMAQLGTAQGETTLETPRLDGVIVEGFAARLPRGGFLLTFRDVTRQQQAEAELQRSREHLYTLVETVPHGILECDRHGIITFCNRTYARMHEAPRSEIIGRSVHQLIRDLDSRDAAQQTFLQVLYKELGHGSEVVRNLSPSGAPLWRQIDWAARRTANGEVDGLIAVVTDITERRRHEEQELQAHLVLRSVLQNTPLAIAVLDGNDQVTLWNRTAALLFDREESEILGRSLAAVAVAGEQHPAFAQVLTAARQGQTARRELAMLPRRGGTLDVAVTAAPLSGNAADAAVILIIDDISERRRTELALRHREETYRNLVEATPVAIFVHIDGYLVYLNPAAVRLFGGTEAAELEGRAIAEFLDGKDLALFRQGLQEASLDTRMVSHFALRIRPLDGGERDIEATFLGIDYNGCETRMALCLDVTERNRASDALRLSEYRYRAIFDQAFQFSGLLDPHGRVLEANRSALDFIGVDNEQVHGRLFWETPWWAPYPDYQEQLRQAIVRGAAGAPSRFEVLNRGRHGQENWIDFSLKPVLDAAGAVIYLVAEGRDITARKRSEELTMVVARGVAAEIGAGFFRSLTRYLAQALRADYALIGELDGEQVQVIAASKAGQELAPFSYPLAGTPCAQVLGQNEVCAYREGVAGAFPDDPLLREMAVEGYAGSPLRDSTGAVRGILVVLFRRPIHDLAQVESLLRIFASRAAAELERRHGELILEESEARFRQLSREFETIFNGIPDQLTVWTAERQLVWANRATSDFFHVPPEHLSGRPCEELCLLGACLADECEINRCLQHNTVSDNVHTTADGKTWGVKIFPLHDGSGTPTRVIRLASDISERVRLREEAARSSHLAALGELAAGVAHEINNPTALILLDLPIIRDAFHDALPLLEDHFRRAGDFALAGLDYSLLREQLPQLLAEVLEGAQSIKQIVDELKDFARPTDPRQFAAVDLSGVVRKAVHLVGNQLRKATDRFTLDCPAQLPATPGNPQRLEQVMINLILNACQALATREQGIHISLRHEGEHQRNLIEVRDEGCGIRPEHLALVTDPFFTTRREVGGTGLGLSVSTRIIEEHGGTLHIESQPGHGTRITVALPTTLQEPPHD